MIYMLVANTTALNTYIKHNQKRLPKLYKFLLKWKFNIARLNEEIDIYCKRHYKVVDYLIKKPNMRVSEITRTPYGYRQWKRRQQARLRCILHNPQRNVLLTVLAHQTTTRKGKRMHFDTDSFEIAVDNCCSRSITNCLADFLD
jgi:hypothetical protein